MPVNRRVPPKCSTACLRRSACTPACWSQASPSTAGATNRWPPLPLLLLLLLPPLLLALLLLLLLLPSLLLALLLLLLLLTDGLRA